MRERSQQSVCSDAIACLRRNAGRSARARTKPETHWQGDGLLEIEREAEGVCDEWRLGDRDTT